MKRSCLIRGILAAMPLTMATVCFAQYRPATTATIDSVGKGGIYRIVLPPSFVGRCRADMSDLRILADDGKDAPYVLRTDTNDRFNAGFLSIPDPNILQKDSSDRHSYYWLQYDAEYRIDRLSLIIEGPPLYRREVGIMSVEDGHQPVPVAAVTIEPKDTVVHLSPIWSNRLLIAVANHDNAPLAITRVVTAQSGICLLAYLQPDHHYRLAAGDPNAAAPDYDLHFFTDNPAVTPATIGLGPVQKSSEIAATREKAEDRAHLKSRLTLWSVVTLILLLLIYVSVKLAGAVDQQNKQ